MDLEPDAFEAVRQVYAEYLDERFQNDPGEKRHRAAQLDNGHPVWKDEAKIKAGQEAYLEATRDGRSEVSATNEARQALFGQHYREQIKEKEVDPRLYATNQDYRSRMDSDIDKRVAEKLEARQEKAATPTNTNEAEQTRRAGSQQGQETPQAEQQKEIDWERYTQDKGYQRQVNELVTKPQAQRPNDRNR